MMKNISNNAVQPIVTFRWLTDNFYDGLWKPGIEFNRSMPYKTNVGNEINADSLISYTYINDRYMIRLEECQDKTLRPDETEVSRYRGLRIQDKDGNHLGALIQHNDENATKFEDQLRGVHVGRWYYIDENGGSHPMQQDQKIVCFSENGDEILFGSEQHMKALASGQELEFTIK